MSFPQNQAHTPVLPQKFHPSKAMVFAAGLGKRMHPLTLTCPKPLIHVGGRALIDYTLDALAHVGVKTAIVNVHWLAEQIETHLAHRKRPQILLSDERDQLKDQGGAIFYALSDLGTDPFFICNTDSFWQEDPQAPSNLERMIQMWDPDCMDILLLVAHHTLSLGARGPGDFDRTENGQLKRLNPTSSLPFFYTGIGLIKPELFSSPPSLIFPLAPFFFKAAQAGRLFGVTLKGFWYHVGDLDAQKEVEQALGPNALK